MNNLPSEILIELSKNIDNSNWHNEKWSKIISRIKELTAYISIGKDFIDGKSCFTELSIETMKLQYLCMSYPINDDRALFNNKNLKIELEYMQDVKKFYNEALNQIDKNLLSEEEASNILLDLEDMREDEDEI